jgi:hypothetical protein
MSEKKTDKGRIAKKLHHLQKSITRSEAHPGHHSTLVDVIIKSKEKKLMEKLKGKNKK